MIIKDMQKQLLCVCVWPYLKSISRVSALSDLPLKFHPPKPHLLDNSLKVITKPIHKQQDLIIVIAITLQTDDIYPIMSMIYSKQVPLYACMYVHMYTRMYICIHVCHAYLYHRCFLHNFVSYLLHHWTCLTSMSNSHQREFVLPS